jgi:hypothetical protein
MEEQAEKPVQKFKDWSVLSSQIKTTEYNEQEKYMFVVFSNGTKYRYAEVPLDVWEKSLKAASIGKFINTDIKPNFEFKRLN